MATQTPQRPAAAYALVAEMLQADYFTRPPVDDGIELTVVHSADRVPTRWIFSHATADAVEIRLRKNRAVSVRRDPWKRRAA